VHYWVDLQLVSLLQQRSSEREMLASAGARSVPGFMSAQTFWAIRAPHIFIDNMKDIWSVKT